MEFIYIWIIVTNLLMLIVFKLVLDELLELWDELLDFELKHSKDILDILKLIKKKEYK